MKSPLQIEIYKKAKSGDKVIFYVDKYLYPVYSVSENIITSTVIGSLKGSQNLAGIDDIYVLGWKTEEIRIKNSYSMSSLSKRDIKNPIHNFNDYIYTYKWYLNEMYAKEIMNDQSTAIAKHGHWCKSCSTYSAYADSNQKDGTFVCWSCRSYPYWGKIIK